MTITLEAIEAQQSKLSEDHARINAVIEEFKKRLVVTEITFPAVTIPFAAGERYAGMILGEGSQPNYHLILMPGEAESLNWADAQEWAADRGGELPTRREQSFLFANLKGEFSANWYWSAEAREDHSGWAWIQDFYDGSRSNDPQSNEFRARAVRRFIPSVI